MKNVASEISETTSKKVWSKSSFGNSPKNCFGNFWNHSKVYLWLEKNVSEISETMLKSKATELLRKCLKPLQSTEGKKCFGNFWNHVKVRLQRWFGNFLNHFKDSWKKHLLIGNFSNVDHWMLPLKMSGINHVRDVLAVFSGYFKSNFKRY